MASSGAPPPWYKGAGKGPHLNSSSLQLSNSASPLPLMCFLLSLSWFNLEYLRECVDLILDEPASGLRFHMFGLPRNARFSVRDGMHCVVGGSGNWCCCSLLFSSQLLV